MNFGVRKGFFIMFNKVFSSLAILAFIIGLLYGMLDLTTKILGIFFVLWILYCWFSEINGYSLVEKKLIIHRKMNDLVFLLNDISAIEEIKSKDISSSFGTHLNIFSWMGNFYAKSIGSYEAYLTNTKDIICIILPYKKILVSPKNKELFKEQLRTIL